MDIEYFLKSRTIFIIYFYEHASSVFNDTKGAIDDAREPYFPKYYPGQDKPAYLDEWVEAETGLGAVGHSCVSMLSSSVHLFLKSWVVRLESDHGIELDVNFKKTGWFNGYRKILERLGYDISNSGADIDIIEQVVLARNRVQHTDQLTIRNVSHADSNLSHYPNPIFVSEYDGLMLEQDEDEDGDLRWWFCASVALSKERLFEAIEHVEKLCTWLESEYWRAKNA